MVMAMFHWVKKVVPAYIVAADGSGDFTTIQAAIDALPATGGQVIVRAGTYTITSAITINKSNVRLSGTGKGSKILTTSNIRMINLGPDTAVTNVIIEDLYLYGAGSVNVSNHGIYLVEGRDCKILSCYIENCGMSGITLAYIGTQYNFVAYNQCNSNKFNGISLVESIRNIVVLNTCDDNSNNGISLTKSVGTSSYNKFEGNYCDSNGAYGIYIEVDNFSNTVINNTFTNNTTADIQDDGTDTQMGHNITS